MKTSSTADSFFKSASGQLANSFNKSGHKGWSADGSITDPSTIAPAATPSSAVAPTTPAASAPCGCPDWHKPSCFVGGLIIGALVAYILVKKEA